MSEITTEMGEHIFTVDFEYLKGLAKKIKPELYQGEIVERINKYSNDKNELKLATIIDFTNEITVVKETLFLDEEAEDNENQISKKSCEDIIEYLENFVSHKVFNVQPEDLISNSNEEIKTDVIENSTPKLEENIFQEPLNKEKTTISNITTQYSDENEIQEDQQIKNTNSLNNISSEELNRQFENILKTIEFNINEGIKTNLDSKIQDLHKNWKQDIQNLINKSDSDKKIVESGLDNIKLHIKNSQSDFIANLTKNIETLVSTVDNFNKTNNTLIVDTIKIEMEKAINEGKIKSELEEEHVKALKGVKTAVIFSVITAICAFSLCLVGVKWYSNSVKYQNIEVVVKNLPPYEQDLFNQIITKGYANTRDNPRNR